jgi:hypothetical protein
MIALAGPLDLKDSIPDRRARGSHQQYCAEYCVVLISHYFNRFTDHLWTGNLVGCKSVEFCDHQRRSIDPRGANLLG